MGVGGRMKREALEQLMSEVAGGRTSPAEAVKRLETLPFEDLGFARIDHHRQLRCGFPEVIFGRGKRAKDLIQIFERLAERGSNVLVTRVRRKTAKLLLERFPAGEYNGLARTVTLRQTPARRSGGFVGVVCAGTSDLPVAEEARVTAEIMDQTVRTFYDVGVAGIHRLLAQSAELREARVLVVVAGMEGALPSVVGGLVECPVIAVPTSVGYGANLGGIAALLTMLNSCAAGVSVVNIDNGFGAGYQAAVISRRIEQAAQSNPIAEQSTLPT